MGQAGYAENFVSFMLGWIRSLAASIAGLFRTRGGASSGGLAITQWLSKNWLILLIVLIVIGILTDWIIWLIRWRPHWLWFRKPRVILDDRVEENVSEKKLQDAYDMREKRAPSFRSRALPREYDPIEEEYDSFEEEYDPIEEEYGFFEEEYEPTDEAVYEEYDVLEEAGFFTEYEEPETLETGKKKSSRKERNRQRIRQRLMPEPQDEEWDDIPTGREKRRMVRKNAKKAVEDDPFTMDEAVIRDLDDDFFDVISEHPHPEVDEELRLQVLPEFDEEEKPLSRRERRRSGEAAR